MIVPALPPELWRKVIKRTVRRSKLGLAPALLQERIQILTRLSLVSSTFHAIALEFLYAHVLVPGETTARLLCRTLEAEQAGEKMIGRVGQWIKALTFGFKPGRGQRWGEGGFACLVMQALVGMQLASVAFCGLRITTDTLAFCAGEPSRSLTSRG